MPFFTKEFDIKIITITLLCPYSQWNNDKICLEPNKFDKTSCNIPLHITSCAVTIRSLNYIKMTQKIKLNTTFQINLNVYFSKKMKFSLNFLFSRHSDSNLIKCKISCCNKLKLYKNILSLTNVFAFITLDFCEQLKACVRFSTPFQTNT